MKIIKVLGLLATILSVSTLPSNAQQILDGAYGTGPVDGAMTIKGEKYQEYGEGFYSKWKSTSELKTLKKGVVLSPRGTYFCLVSMMKNNKWILPSGKYAECSAKGWVYVKPH